eukprot:scaffold97144_cov49-Phaeocystis_antarctica.AAC.2
MDTACVLLLATEVVMATACRSEVAQQNERSHFFIPPVGWGEASPSLSAAFSLILILNQPCSRRGSSSLSSA